jgi:UDPglucose 6-dehydrogenase
VEPEQIQKDLTHPYVTDNPEKVIKSIEIHNNPYTAADTTHAIVVCTEWDEFMKLDYERIYRGMMKPAFIFDGRKILNHDNLAAIGFQVHTIGKR